MRKFVFLLGFIMIFGAISFVSASDDSNDTMTVEVNVYESTVGIDVPERVSFGDIAKGYLSERQEIEVKNTGTTDIVVTPELVNSSEEIFEYLSFRNILDDPLTRVGFFDVEIEKPSEIGSEREEDLYMYLDLTDYIGEINNDMMGHEAEVIFWALEA